MTLVSCSNGTGKPPFRGVEARIPNLHARNKHQRKWYENERNGDVPSGLNTVSTRNSSDGTVSDGRNDKGRENSDRDEESLGEHGVKDGVGQERLMKCKVNDDDDGKDGYW